jgi:hypothetical protein
MWFCYAPSGRFLKEEADERDKALAEKTTEAERRLRNLVPHAWRNVHAASF